MCRFLFARALALALLLACLPVMADLDQPTPLLLPQQSLQKSIIALGRACEISIVVPSSLLEHYRAPAVEGLLTPRAALERLLENTPLTIREVNSRVVAIVPKPRSHDLANAAQVTLEVHEELIIIGHQVTGSLLNRTDLQGSSPVDIITEHVLDTSGSQSVADFLKYIPAVSGNSTSTAISNGGDGTATITLRGLPANNTLVLLNGKRTTSDGLDGYSVDLNSIPSAAVERVEILKDGASAIYGTDAIAGVVNIITKKDYDGLQLEQYFGSSYKNDIETTTTHVMWGKSGDRGSMLVSAQYFDQNGLFSRERSLSANADGTALGGVDKRSTATPNARVTIDSGDVVTLSEGEIGISSMDYRTATEDDRFNYLSQTSSISPSTRKSILLSTQYSLSPNVSFTGLLNYNATEAIITFASTPIFTSFENIPLTVSQRNIYNPFNQDVEDVRRRIIEMPPREQINESDSHRINLTLDGFNDDSEWELSAHWSRTQAHETVTNNLSSIRTARALGPSDNCLGSAIDGCESLNLFGPEGSITPAQLAYLTTSNSTKGYTKLYGLSAAYSTKLAELPAGPLYLGMGTELRREVIESSPTSASAAEPAIGNITRSPTMGSREIFEAFSETHIPLLRHQRGIHSLDLELALRYSQYSDFGSNTSPKFGIRFRPTSGLLFRATYSEGFRAPNLGELYTGSVQSQLPLSDPCAIAENVGVLPGCELLADSDRIQFLTTFAGEPNLNPETSTSSTFGVVWTPEVLGDLYISLDQFTIHQKNIVTSNAQIIVDRNARYSEFEGLVERDRRGNITGIFSPFINVGQRDISGVDSTVRWSTSARYGRLSYSFNASYLDEYSYKLGSNTGFNNLEGTFEDASREGSGALPRWKANTGLLWSLDRAEYSYTVNHIASVTEKIPFTNDKTREIGSWNTHDTQFSYRFGDSKQLRLSLGINNIFNKPPPFSAAAFNDNYDARTYDIKGQFWYARVSWEI